MKIDIYSDNPITNLEYKIAVMQAAQDGKMVQAKSRYQGSIWGQEKPLVRIGWDWSTCVYRIAPSCREKKIIPWTADTIPFDKPVWIKTAGDSAFPFALLIGVDKNGCPFSHHAPTTYENLYKGFVYTPTPQDASSWKPCGTEVFS